MSLQTYYSRKHEAVDPLVFNKVSFIHSDFSRTNDSFLKIFQWELLYIKISKSHANYTTKKLPPSDCLCWEIRAWVPREGEASHSSPQPIPRPHRHLKCHWLIKFLFLSSFIKFLCLLSLLNFILTIRPSILRPCFFQ